MSTIDPARRRDFGDLVTALIEEAWQRARRRRSMYAAVAFAVVAAIVFATMNGPATSQGTSPARAADPGVPTRQLAAAPHVYVGAFDVTGRRGYLNVYVYFENSSGSRSWDVGSGNRSRTPFGGTGQYLSIRLARGEHVQAGGHADEWYARLFGVVTPRGQAVKKQRVVIELTGRPTGTFKLIPTEPGVLKRDSGIQSSLFRG